MSRIVNISRRDFLRTGAMVGGGFILGFSIPTATPAAAKAEDPDFAKMTPAEKAKWNIERWKRIIGNPFRREQNRLPIAIG